MPDIYPEITAEKIFYEPDSMNLTEMELVKSAVSDAGPGSAELTWLLVAHGRLIYPRSGLWIPEIGVTAELFWFHDKGYFEEFLDGKSGEIWTCKVPRILNFYRVSHR